MFANEGRSATLKDGPFEHGVGLAGSQGQGLAGFELEIGGQQLLDVKWDFPTPQEACMVVLPKIW